MRDGKNFLIGQKKEWYTKELDSISYMRIQTQLIKSWLFRLPKDSEEDKTKEANSGGNKTCYSHSF